MMVTTTKKSQSPPTSSEAAATTTKKGSREAYNKQRMIDFVRIVQNGQNVDACDDFFSPNFYNPDLERIMKSTGNGQERGGGEEESSSSSCDDNNISHVEEDKKLHRMLFRAFPDIKVTILDMAADENKVWTYKKFEGTHTGPWMMVDTDDMDNSDIIVEPTGQHVEFYVIDIMTFGCGGEDEDDGMILDHRCVETFTAVLDKLKKNE